MAELNTYGDLKKVLSIIKAKQRGRNNRQSYARCGTGKYSRYRYG